MNRLLAAVPSARRLAWRVGRWLYCTARGEQLPAEIEKDGEAYVQACVIDAVPSDRRLHVIDIGANQGDWVRSFIRQLPAARRRDPSVRIDLFEPVPITLERLRRLLDELDAAKFAEIHALAISDEIGKGNIAIMSATGGTNSLHFDRSAPEPPGGWIEVEKTTLADFCRARRVDHVHLVKIDTEGHDLSVLRGAQELLIERRVDVLQFEYNHLWIHSRSFLKDVFELIGEMPFRIARIEPTSIEILDHWHFELDRFFPSNFVIVAEHALTWFDVRRGRFDVSNTFA